MEASASTVGKYEFQVDCASYADLAPDDPYSKNIMFE